MTHKRIADSLTQSGLSISPNFLNSHELQSVRQDLQSIQRQGSFQKAKIGQNAESARHVEIRSDNIHWLERDSANLVQAILWQKIDALQSSLNRNLFLGLRSFEGHYASFPKEAFYSKHFDCFQQDQTRVISMTIYLNDRWQRDDGGELRVFGNSGYQDIEPIGGTMVCFLSEESEHQVQKSRRERLSFTGWFRRD